MINAATTVLVVEDEPLVRMAIVDHLIDEGFVVLEAANADEAVAILVTNLTIHIMFTDIDMPGGTDGLKLAAAVRDRWPPIKIVVTSGHRAIAAGDLPAEAQFFSKPYSPDTIVNTFRQLMGG
ncbi:response regulator [Devosia sp. 2618]|uniref:response regulator n=1 Tax=Devosia sp. 2618 TaxID=3156454 RepID=UPI003399F41D